MLGRMPAIANFLFKLEIIGIIDGIVGYSRSSLRLTHGETAFIFIMYMMTKRNAVTVYKLEKWVSQTPCIQLLFPESNPHQLSEERVGRTLDSIYPHIRDIIFLISKRVIELYKLRKISAVNMDLTNFSVYGNYRNQPEDCEIIKYMGHPKNHDRTRQGLALEVAVESETGFFLHVEVVPGNTADVTRYINMWIEVCKKIWPEFIAIGDCKIASKKNLLFISKHHGKYLAPEYEFDLKTLKKELADPTNTLELLLEVKHSKNRTVFYTGFDTESKIIDDDDKKQYYQRRIIVHSSELESEQRQTLERRKVAFEKGIKDIQEQSLARKYGKVDDLSRKIKNIITKNSMNKYVDYTVEEKIAIIEKNAKRGRPPKGSKPDIVKTEIKWAEFSYTFDLQGYKKLFDTIGFFTLETNVKRSEMSKSDLLILYKGEHIVESFFRSMKTSGIVPSYLHSTKRIAVYTNFSAICTQICIMMQREVSENLKLNKKLLYLFPKNRGVSHTSAEFMLQELDSVAASVCKTNGVYDAVITDQKPDSKAETVFELMNVDVKYWRKEGIQRLFEEMKFSNEIAFEEFMRNKIMYRKSL
ncbi:MAG: IS1634 family transposase [Holosporaceae bacterium]|jgi:transposase|nr:IS1634 family transposase [Holosporaceae bacterium]